MHYLLRFTCIRPKNSFNISIDFFLMEPFSFLFSLQITYPSSLAQKNGYSDSGVDHLTVQSSRLMELADRYVEFSDGCKNKSLQHGCDQRTHPEILTKIQKNRKKTDQRRESTNKTAFCKQNYLISFCAEKIHSRSQC